MKVHVYAADDSGCGKYRLRWPAAACGDDVVDRWGCSDFGEALIEDRGGKHTVVAGGIVPDCDVVVLQRPLVSTRLALIDFLQANGVAVVVDVDDDFSALDPRNVAWKDCHPGHSPDRNWHWLKRACASADLVTVSTPALAKRYGAHGRVAVLRNCIPQRYLSESRDDHEGVYVGWSGSLDTHPGDLQTTRGAIADVGRKYGSRFAVIGTGRGVADALDLDGIPHASGWVDIERYPEALAQLDVGIVPLADTKFNQAKSWLKGLEMAAVGVPFVASPLPEYDRLAKLGAGKLASSRKDWVAEVGLLVRSATRRAELAARGRQVAQQWTIERHAERWLSAWSEAPVFWQKRHRRAA